MWPGSFTGLSTEITAVPLTSGDDSVDDEAWLLDESTLTWVETGEINVNAIYYGGGVGTTYFWAYGTPGDQSMNYYLGPVSQSDLNNNAWIGYRINQDATVSSTWNVTIWEASTGTTLYSPSLPGYSMSPNWILEGQELAGSNGAEAQFAFFGQNAFFRSGKMSFQTSDVPAYMGTSPSYPGPPPHAGWWPASKPSQIANGGLFFTWCC
jgi:hypothetical protein